MSMSLSTAKLLYTYATFASILAGVITVGSVVLIFYATDVIDRAADAAITKAQTSALEAIQGASEANQAAAEANQNAEATRAENLKLQLQLEKERADRLNLEGKLGPRKIPVETAEIFIEALSRTQPFKAKIYTGVNPEPIALGKQIADCLQQAEKSVIINNFTKLRIVGTPDTGVYINIKQDLDGSLFKAFSILGHGYHVRRPGEKSKVDFSKNNIGQVDQEFSVIINIKEKLSYIST